MGNGSGNDTVAVVTRWAVGIFFVLCSGREGGMSISQAGTSFVKPQYFGLLERVATQVGEILSTSPQRTSSIMNGSCTYSRKRPNTTN